MSNYAGTYHNAWCSAFSRPDRKLLCSWHVDRSWRRKLNEYFKDAEQHADVYVPLKNLQNETTEKILATVPCMAERHLPTNGLLLRVQPLAARMGVVFPRRIACKHKHVSGKLPQNS